MNLSDLNHLVEVCKCSFVLKFWHIILFLLINSPDILTWGFMEKLGTDNSLPVLDGALNKFIFDQLTRLNWISSIS